METVHEILEKIILIVSGLGAIVVIWGVIEAIKSFIVMKFARGEKEAVAESETIRQRLGAHLLLGLEIFIAADIISTVITPTWEKVGILAVIVAIRTVLSYFLRIELKEGIHDTSK
jgi:uncharacterized membrane protein